MDKDNSKEKTLKDKDGKDVVGLDLNNDYVVKKPLALESSEKIQKELEKTKKELEKLKSFILKKFSFIQAIGLIHKQSINIFLEEEIGENIPETEMQKLKNKIHLFIIVPEDKFKEIPKIKNEIISEIQRTKQNVWIYVKTPIDIWEACFDSKFDMVSAIGMSFPIHDKGILGALRVSQIHKSLVLQKFDRYVVSYVIAGSLVRGDVTKESDIDSFVIINDTDVKRMPRLELKERLRSMIYQYIAEANAIAGMKKNILNVQVYLLTDFWESVKDAHPVMFTFIRDGVPLYDRGTFLPWKALLKMGRLKPSPEAIDMFMSMGDKTTKRAKAVLLDILVHDVYWGVLTPSQALLMLYGLPPPTPKQTVSEIKKVFVDKEKMLEKKYYDILEKIVKIYKDFEHEKIKEIKGAELDKILEETDSYLNRLKQLRVQIEKRAEEKTIEQIYKDTFALLESIFGKKKQKDLISDFENLVKKGKFTQQHSRILMDIIKAKSEFKKGQTNIHKIDEVRKNAVILINDLIDYSQRLDLIALEKNRMIIKYNKAGKEMAAELLNFNGASFLFIEGKIIKIDKNLTISNTKEVQEFIENQKLKKGIKIDPHIFELLKKEIGDFEIIL
ncbi:MAG: nucleotidyltransferase domain-containing protein [Candidatus Pacearchaeota archaeon]